MYSECSSVTKAVMSVECCKHKYIELFYLVVLINIRLAVFNNFIQGIKFCIRMYSMLASNYTHTVFQRWLSLCLFLNIIIFVVILYIMFSNLSVHYCARNIRRIVRAVRSSEKKCDKEDWNSHSWCLKMSTCINIYHQVIVIINCNL